MQNTLSEIVNYLLGQSWQIGAVFIVVAVGCWLLRKSSAHWRYLLWLIVLVKCLVPPILNVPVAVLPESPSATLWPAEVLPLAMTATEASVAEPMEIASEPTFEPIRAPLAVTTEPVPSATWPSLTRGQ